MLMQRTISFKQYVRYTALLLLIFLPQGALYMYLYDTKNLTGLVNGIIGLAAMIGISGYFSIKAFDKLRALTGNV